MKSPGENRTHNIRQTYLSKLARDPRSWVRHKLILMGLLGLLTACGSEGDGGGGTNQPPPAQPPTQSVSTVAASVGPLAGSLTFALNAMSGDTTGTVRSVRAFSRAQSKDVPAGVRRFYAALKSARTTTPRVASLCPDGGTIDTTETSTGFTVVATQCRVRIDTNGDRVADAERLTNGALSFQETSDSFTITATNFLAQVTNLSTGRLLAETREHFTASGTVQNTTVCDGELVPSVFSTVLSGTFTTTLDTDNNGLLDVDTSVQAQSFALAVQVNSLNASTCEPTALSASATGKLVATDNLEANESFSLDISSSNPLLVTVQLSTGGSLSTLSGSFALTSSCFSGSLTVATPTPIFFPEDDCPTAGILTVTGDLRGTITFTSTGGVNIDTESDGTVDQMLRTCEEAQVCM